MERGEDEGLYINTTGIGFRPTRTRLGVESVRPGDAVILSGAIGEHEAAIAVARGAYRFKGRVKSDCAPLHGLIDRLPGGVRVMRDPTRGGLATVLNEFADGAGLGIVVDAETLPIPVPVRGVARLLGLDPLYMANEGKVVVIAAPQSSTRILAAMRRHRLGRAATRIGSVVSEPRGVWLKTSVGGLRPLITLEGEQLPRIC
ncbi:hypothetical protein FJY69_09230 [candidate division WOR-3 bacterium]|nr:hypothetical protein [candidate division WOR-3 bacterium]